jgi:hypothetical protein
MNSWKSLDFNFKNKAGHFLHFLLLPLGLNKASRIHPFLSTSYIEAENPVFDFTVQWPFAIIVASKQI